MPRFITFLIVLLPPLFTNTSFAHCLSPPGVGPVGGRLSNPPHRPDQLHRWPPVYKKHLTCPIRRYMAAQGLNSFWCRAVNGKCTTLTDPVPHMFLAGGLSQWNPAPGRQVRGAGSYLARRPSQRYSQDSYMKELEKQKVNFLLPWLTVILLW